MEQVANPSQWIAEIYVPIQAKPTVVYKPKPAEETPPTTPIEPATENTEP